jgi:polar amino acid transport system substrate-binding protein
VTAARAIRVLAGLIVCAPFACGGCASVIGQSQHRPRRTLEPRLHPAPSPKNHQHGCHGSGSMSLAPSKLPPPGHMPAGTFMRTIQNRGHLIAGFDQNSLGLGYFNRRTQRFEGFDVELARDVARAIFGTPRVAPRAITTEQRESAIVNNEVDIVASAFSVTCQRRRRMLFSSVYYRAQQRLLVPKNSTVDGLSDPDLRGKKVCATRGSTSLERLKQNPDVIAFPEDQRSDCLVDLEEGDVAAVTSDDAILFGFMQEDPTTKIVGPCIGIERYGMAINKAHRPFVRFVNAVLARLRRNGKATKLRKRWLNGLTPPTAAELSRCDRQAPR